MARQTTKGSTNVSTTIRIIDSTDGTPETGVTSATGGLALEYRREGAASTAITESDLSALTDAHSDGGMLHIGNGYYRVDIPDAAFATGADGVLIHGTATGMVVIGEYHELLDVDLYDAVRGGMTALPNAAADAAGGLPISDAGGLDLDTQLAATNEVTAARMGALTDWIDGGRLDLILDAILVDTAEIGAAGAGLTVLATAANLTTVDTVVDSILSLLDDARAEPGQGAPPVNPDMATKVDYLYKFLRNKIETTATTISVYDDAGTTVDHKSTISDDATTFTRGEFATGP